MEIKTKKELSDAASTFAQSYGFVKYGGRLYVPVHYQTGAPAAGLTAEEKIWRPLDQQDVVDFGNEVGDILFATQAEIMTFELMLRQYAQQGQDTPVILLRTNDGVQTLYSDGSISAASGQFVPNYIRPKINDNQADMDEVFKVISEWVGGDDVAHSLLHHLATSLAPGWSAIKYVLLIGEGRNGKGVLLSMLAGLFGKENVSGITRSMMSEKSPTLTELNGKLLNLVFDGEMGYLKDSSLEKTLVAGESAQVRKLYESGTTRVQTNALFVEALNKEPKTRDKGPALQKRLARFYFPNVYAVDHGFHAYMTGERMLGALLAQLHAHYVEKKEAAQKLKLTFSSLELQMESMWTGSSVLQYLEHLHSTDPDTIERMRKGAVTVAAFLASFNPWLMSQGQNERSDGDLVNMMKEYFDLAWRGKRVHGKSTSERYIKGIKETTEMVLQHLENGEGNGLDGLKLVGD